ncbi:cytochrome b/b6 domain-containing protein [Pseudoxanthobacter sp. M-2]|uniref:cytochrome b/b6 domain-containing protein n=1 Tax=Pseudoxanthobacter sp. M-2 TaxID=3078754 RepID=UPI0038FD1FF0
MATETDRVFSPLVRIGHWGGALAFLVAYVTAGRPLSLHTRVGYALAAYVVWRLVWGLVGPARSRFADLMSSPRAYYEDLMGLLRARPIRHVGLGPIGSLLAVSMLVSIVLASVAGVVTLAQRHGDGPLAAFIGSVPEPVPNAITRFGEDGGMTIIPRTDRASIDTGAEHPDVKPGRWIKRVHGTLSLLALWLVVLHIVHVLYASVVRGENLLYDMVTGRRAPQAEPVAPPRPVAPAASAGIAPAAAPRPQAVDVAPPPAALAPPEAPAGWPEPEPDEADEEKAQKKLQKRAQRKERRREGRA